MPKLRSITIDELDNIKLDENNQLYWLDKEIVTKKVISLNLYEKILTTIIAIGTGLTGLESALNIFYHWSSK